MFKRKIYDKLLEWKRQSDGNTALLVEGARRIGKSTIVEEFGKNEVTVQPFVTGRLHLSNIFSSRERLRLVASVTVLSSEEPR